MPLRGDVHRKRWSRCRNQAQFEAADSCLKNNREVCREEEDRAEAARKEAEKEAAERAATQAAAERLRGSALRRAPSTPADSGSDAAPLYMALRPATGTHGAVPAVSTLSTRASWPHNTHLAVQALVAGSGCPKAYRSKQALHMQHSASDYLSRLVADGGCPRAQSAQREGSSHPLSGLNPTGIPERMQCWQCCCLRVAADWPGMYRMSWTC